MLEMQTPSIGDEYKKEQFDKIKFFVKKLLNEKNLEIEIPHTKDDIYISMHGNRLPLDSYGTGIHQLIILCSALVMNTDKIVCIEEPEVYLHPELQRIFLNFLINYTNNIYFISTHSNIFIDFNNGIIWVEGPSDRIYLKNWILLLDENLEEGLHYSIMFYGGRLLSHLSVK